MFTAFLQVLDWVKYGQIHYFILFFAYVWIIWMMKVVVARFYRPFKEDFKPTTSVLIPIVDEPEDLFREVLKRIVEQKPDEIMVVINGKQNPKIISVCLEFQPSVR